MYAPGVLWTAAQPIVFTSDQPVGQRGRGDWGAQFIDTYFDGNVIPEFWYAYDPASDVMTIVWNERLPRADPAGYTR